MASGKVETVQVILRCRPATAKESHGGQEPALRCDTERKEVALRDARIAGASDAGRVFTFDAVFAASSTQLQVCSCACIKLAYPSLKWSVFSR